MIRNSLAVSVLLAGVLAIAVAGVAQQPATEAPAGFATPTLAKNPGSQSVSNGIAEPPGDTYALDQSIYEEDEDASTGLGPVFNARACADCHQNPVSGGSSQFTEIRAGHHDANGNFVAATVPINDGANTIALRSIINDRALSPAAQEHIPDTENIRALRAALNTLGDGFVEAIDDSTLETIAQNQIAASGGRIHGEAVEVPVLEAPGQTRIGRFGWKDQHSSLLSFVGDAYLNEMGVTNRLRPHDVTTIGKITADPEDTPDNLGLAAIDHFTQFIRGTQVPRETLRSPLLQHLCKAKSSLTRSAAPPATSPPSSQPPREPLSTAAPSPFRPLSATKSFIPTATSCCMTSIPATASCKIRPPTPPINCAPCRSGDCAPIPGICMT